MVVRVIWRVARWICYRYRVYVTYGTKCVGIKVVKSVNRSDKTIGLLCEGLRMDK